MGFGVGYIPWSSVDRFIDRALGRGEIDGDEAEALEELILALDADEVLAYSRKSAREEDEGDKPRRKGRRHDDDDE